jgi:regulator of protease activity HflC (stomatin/prohibitin superfamily)
MGATYFSTRFFSEFYRPPDGVIPSKLINYRLFGRLKLPPPLNMFSQFKYVIVKDGQIEKPDKWAAWASQHVGGPITLIVFDGCALYLERGNRFSRVVGPGNKIPFLEWYETIKYVVDLRPKVKVDSFNVWTKDGIKIKLTARVTCRIGDPIKKDPGSELVYPYDPIAVKKAIERYALRWPNPLEEPSEFTWIDAVWGQVTGIVPGYIGSRMLDDLLMAERQSGQILSPEAVKELIGKLNQASNGFGVYVLDFQIQNIEVPARVTKQQEENWKAERQGMATVIDGQAKAFNIRSREKARAEAQRDLILAIADGLEKNTSGNYAEPLLLSLSGVLDESLQDPYIRATIAGETLDTLEKLQKILDRPSHNG